MNIILFEKSEVGGALPRSDRRVGHILDVLRRKIGDSTDVGLINGPRGKAILRAVDENSASFDFKWGAEPEALLPIELIVGLSRPQTSRKILQEATSLGVKRIFFVGTERGEPSYGTSKLWTTNEWLGLVRTGVEQAFTTRFPEVRFGIGLAEAIEVSEMGGQRICMDNYEAPVGLAGSVKGRGPFVLAVGSERGWTGKERAIFRENGFVLAHLGERPLRTETATIASISVVSALMEKG